MASIMSFSIDATVYIWLSLAAIFLFGPHLKEDMLDNMVQLGGVISPMLRILFSLILVLDIPFMFFATKEQSLVMHDELVNRSISRHCDRKARRAAQQFQHSTDSLSKEEEGESESDSTMELNKNNLDQLSAKVFFWHAIILHVACISLGILLSNIDIIFDLIGAITCSLSTFIFPSYGYLLALWRY